MKLTKVFSIMCLGLFAVGLAAAQSATVTNADLEKYRQKRLAAERDLRENYARLGFPSPEELERRNAESARQREELAARLERERLERERIEAEYRAAEFSAGEGIVVINEQPYRTNAIYGYSYPFGFRSRRGRGHRFRGPVVRWRATPGGVIYEPGGRSSFIWTPRPLRLRPAFRQR